MQTKWFARAGVGLFLAIVATVSIVEMRSLPAAVERAAGEGGASAHADPLRAELVRCQGIGEAGASDPACLRAWAENRRRFLALGARPGPPLPDDNEGTDPAGQNSGAAITTNAGGAQ
jgi:conjugative transfer region protein TrbK